MIENLTTATPVEIDTELAAAWADYYRQADQADRYAKYAETNDAYAEKMREHQAKADEILSGPIAELNAEFTRRGGWARAYLVVNNGTGHVHSSTRCSTTYTTTRFAWMVDYADHSETDIIDAAGERACTICYPNAPVGVKGTRMFTTDEITAQKNREERAAKRAAADAAKITVTWTSESNGRVGEREFKTLRGLTNELASILSSLVWYGESHPYASTWTANLAAGREIAEARGWDYDKALTAQRKKATREGGEPKF